MGVEKTTGEFAAKHALKLDWVARHEFLSWLQQAHPQVYAGAMQCLGPDQALGGFQGGHAPPAVIVLGDKRRTRRGHEPEALEAARGKRARR